MKIYITRHGETEWNIEGRMQGWNDSKLTDKGVEDARRLGESLKHINFDHIFCSPLTRTIDSAKYIMGNKKIKIITDERIKEMGFGVWEGMQHSEIKKSYPVQYENFWNHPHLFETVGGENFTELMSRVKSWLNDLVSIVRGENVLVVTHTCVIKAVYATFKNYNLENFWSLPYLEGTSVTVIEILDNKAEFLVEADASHLY